ncbi:MAG: sulfurtransferase [Acidobacteria bacterium]|nr:sulfurtransferase [Acidobacteriota bacterium]
MQELPYELSPAELFRQLAGPAPPRLIDCREPFERELARIEPSVLIPMRAVPGELQDIETMAADANVVVYCHHGVRSLNVVAWLRRNGVENCQSLAGGIDRWSLDVDRGVARY